MACLADLRFESVTPVSATAGAQWWNRTQNS
jgi:hypothetical protein